MNKPFERLTQRIYNSQPLLARCVATVTKVGVDYIELDRTVAYAEGGGQEPDHGVIYGQHGSLVFDNVQKMYTNAVQLNNFPEIAANGVIWHYPKKEDCPQLAQFAVGDTITMAIDVQRRAALSISHTASHVLYMAVLQVRPTALEHIFGCRIKTDGARFDFYTEKFSDEEVHQIDFLCNKIVQARHPIETKIHEHNDDAKYWLCAQTSIPCGGTHIDNTGLIERMVVKRKGIGAGKERLLCTFAADVAQQAEHMLVFTQQHAGQVLNHV